MNREQRRMLKKQGQTVNEAGEVVEQKRPSADSSGAGSGGRTTDKGGVAQKESKPSRKDAPTNEEKTSPLQFGKEVKSELSKVSWPSRQEVINYSIVVLVTVVVLTIFIGAIDWLFSTFVLELFEPRQ